MAGTLVIDTLNASTGPLSTNNGMSGIAKAWVAFNGSTAAVYGTAFNVSSITRNSAGNYTVTFTTAMPNANYATSVTTQSTVLSGAAFSSVGGLNDTSPVSTTAVVVRNIAVGVVNGYANQQGDSAYVHVIIFSS